MRALSLSEMIALTVPRKAVWSAKQIAEHKARELAKAPRASIFWSRRVQIASQLETALCAALVLGFLAAGITLLAILVWAGAFFVSAHVAATALTAVGYAAGVTSACGVIFLSILSLDNRTIRGPAEWKRETLDTFGIVNLPAEVRHYVEVRKITDANALFFVHVLRQGSFVLDPILEDNGTYPYVWDEHGDIVEPH